MGVVKDAAELSKFLEIDGSIEADGIGVSPDALHQAYLYEAGSGFRDGEPRK